MRGAALLMAMLTLTLVATLASAAAWQQWRLVEVERAERSRAQAHWMLLGALDWARLILREDARSGGVDHLGEPWAVALQESRLSSFLAQDASSAVLLSEQAHDNVFLAGQMHDLQARLNVNNLIEGGQIAPAPMAALMKLFDLQGLDVAELALMAENLRLASSAQLDRADLARVAVWPQRLDDLTLLGLSGASLARLRPFITWLPARTPINVNTASVEVIYASVPGLELDGARKIAAQRQSQHFKTLADVGQIVPALAGLFNAGQHSVSSQFFEVTGRLRWVDGEQSTVVLERSVVQRDGLDVKVLWRERGLPWAMPDGLGLGGRSGSDQPLSRIMGGN